MSITTYEDPKTADEVRARARAAREAMWKPQKRFLVMPPPVVKKPEPPQPEVSAEARFMAVAHRVMSAAKVYGRTVEEQYPINDILGACAVVGNVKPLDIISPKRIRGIILPRHVFCHLARLHTPLSFPQIGRVIGGRDHSTVLHATLRISAAREDGDQKVIDFVAAVLAILRGE